MSIYDGNDIGLTRPTDPALGRDQDGVARVALPEPEPAAEEVDAIRGLGPQPERPLRRYTRDDLIARIPKAVNAMPGRGCTRDELADELRVRIADLGPALAACYRRKEIDFVLGYVVAPPRVRSVQ